jgi:hypothetical protein
VPLPEFRVAWAEGESDACFLSRVELEAENVVADNDWTKHDDCIKSLWNGGRLNRVFEQVGVAYAPTRVAWYRCQPGGREKKES